MNPARNAAVLNIPMYTSVTVLLVAKKTSVKGKSIGLALKYGSITLQNNTKAKAIPETA